MVNLFYRIREHRFFQAVVISIIIFSALVVGASTYQIDATLMKYLSVLDVAITAFFTIEISIRFVGEEKKKAFFKDGWNIFDTIVVAMSLIPAGIGTEVLLLRLIRIFRVLRLISVLPELKEIIESLFRSLTRVAYVLILIFIIVYIYAAFGSILFSEIDPARWEDIGIAAITLFQVMTLSGWEEVMLPIQEVFSYAWMYFFSFIFITAMVMLNLMVAILVDVVSKSSN